MLDRKYELCTERGFITPSLTFVLSHEYAIGLCGGHVTAEKELIEMTREFVQISSECTPHESYHEITSSIKAHMEDRGIKPEIVRVSPEQARRAWDINISHERFPSASAYAWFDTASLKVRTPHVEKCSILGHVGDGDFTLVLHAHLDTRCLEDEQWEHPPFSGDLVEGCLYGLGAADNKSGIAAALAAVEGVNLHRVSVLLAFTADEEMGGYAGMGYLAESARTMGDLVLSTNGPFYKVNVGCWGRVWTLVSVNAPQSRENAELFHVLREHHFSMNRKLQEFSLQIASIGRNLNGLISVTCNTFSPEFSLPQLYSTLCMAAPQFDFGMKVIGVSDQVVSRKNPLFSHFSTALQTVLGERLTYQMGPVSDIRFALRKGVDAAAFGPIRKDSNVHKPDEHVCIKELVQCVDVYEHFIRALESSLD